MLNARGWTNSRDELTQVRLLDWIYDSTRNGMIPDLGSFLEVDPDVTGEDLEAAATQLRRQGLISVTEMLAGLAASGAVPTDAGQGVVRQREERRADARARTIAAREAVLDWLYTLRRDGETHPMLNRFHNDVRAFFEGEPFTEAEVQEASAHLKERGLISGQGAWGHGVLRPRITSDGEDVVENYEGSVAQWLTAQRNAGSQVVTHFNAPVSDQLGIGEHVTQTQHQGLDSRLLLQLVQDVREAVAEAPPEDQQYLLTYLDVIQAEVTNPEPDADVVKASGRRLQGIAAKVGNAGISATVRALVSAIAQGLGG